MKNTFRTTRLLAAGLAIALVAAALPAQATYSDGAKQSTSDQVAKGKGKHKAPPKA